MTECIEQDYVDIRRCGVELHSKIFKKLTLEDRKSCAKHLGVWHHKQVVLETDDDMDLFMDYAIYAYRPKLFNMAERYSRLFSHECNAFELKLLGHMSKAHYAIYQITHTNNVDKIEAVDVFSKVSYQIVDHHLAKTGYEGLILAGYLIEFGGFAIQTGGSVIVTREILQSDQVVQIIDQMQDESIAEFLSDPINGAKLARSIVGATIKSGPSET